MLPFLLLASLLVRCALCDVSDVFVENDNGNLRIGASSSNKTVLVDGIGDLKAVIAELRQVNAELRRNLSALTMMCDSSPCMHGGTCIDMFNSFLCTCSVDFAGKLCETEFVTYVPFISEWEYDPTDPIIRLPLEVSGEYDFLVDWGDNSAVQRVSSWNSVFAKHVYVALSGFSNSGFNSLNTRVNISISGLIDGFAFNFEGDCSKFRAVHQWGCLRLGNTGGHFYGVKNLVITAVDGPDLKTTWNLARTFMNTSVSGTFSAWDVSTVTNMARMFSANADLDVDLAQWNVSQVVDMTHMFSYCFSFNRPLSSWQPTSVKNFTYFLAYASSFNQPLATWDMSHAINIHGMFEGTRDFNQPLNSWNVTSVEIFSAVFWNAQAFNKPLSAWDVSNARTMSATFYRAANFNQDLSTWCVSRFSAKPDRFDSLALQWTLPKPQWGTCVL